MPSFIYGGELAILWAFLIPKSPRELVGVDDIMISSKYQGIPKKILVVSATKCDQILSRGILLNLRSNLQKMGILETKSTVFHGQPNQQTLIL